MGNVDYSMLAIQSMSISNKSKEQLALDLFVLTNRVNELERKLKIKGVKYGNRGRTKSCRNN